MINLFPKLQDNQYSRQSWGGILFIGTLMAILILLWTEITRALEGSVQLSVDSTHDSRIRVNLDAIIQVPCAALTLNIQDMMGSYLQDVQHTITKTRILDEKLEFITINQNYTSCYGAELLVDQKCYSCQDVMMAFAQRKWRLPNVQSIIQCVGEATVPFDDRDIQQYLQNEKNRSLELQEIKQQLINVTATELFKQSIDMEDDSDDQDATEQIMTQEQRDKFKKALGQLSEYSYNPMQWDEERLKKEKGKQIDQLIGMLNISLDHLGGTLASQLRFSDRERVYPFKNLSNEFSQLTEIYRQKCETTLKIYLNATFNEQVEHFEVEMPKNSCSIPFYHATNEDIMTIKVGNHVLNWKINTNTMMNQFVVAIEKLLVINEEYNYNYQPNAMLDRAYNWFRITVYVHLKRNNRQLFSESFAIEQPTQQYVEVADIEEHINEGCRFFGYFYIKKVPGIFSIQSNQQAMELINHTFKGNHSLRLSFGDTEFQDTKSDYSAKYYLKLVTTNVIDQWGEQKTVYTFTQQRSLANQTIKPFIEFQYEFDPIAMTKISNSISGYCVIVFAVIGGVFAVSKYIAGILNMFL